MLSMTTGGFLVWVALLLRLCRSEVVEEFTAVPNVMRLGHHYHDEKPEAADFEQFATATIFDCLTTKVEAGGIDFIARTFVAARGTPITSLPLSEPLPFEVGDALQISKMANSCASRLSNEPEGDLLDQLALVVYPPNYASGLNFGLRLEVRGYYSAARSVYEFCFRHSAHAGCGMHAAMATPVFASSAVHAQFVYLHVLRSFYRLLSPQSPVQLRPAYVDIDDDYDHIFSLLRDVPGNLQTLGYAPGRILELLSLAVVQHMPQLLTLHNFTQLAAVSDLPAGSVFVDAAFLDEQDAMDLPFAYLPAPPLNPRAALRQRLQRLRQDEEQRRLREQEARPEHEEVGGSDGGVSSSGEPPATVKRLRVGIFSGERRPSASNRPRRVAVTIRCPRLRVVREHVAGAVSAVGLPPLGRRVPHDDGRRLLRPRRDAHRLRARDARRRRAHGEHPRGQRRGDGAAHRGGGPRRPRVPRRAHQQTRLPPRPLAVSRSARCSSDDV